MNCGTENISAELKFNYNRKGMTMNIVIKESNRSRIEDVLSKAQAKCSARCVDYHTIEYMGRLEERKFEERGVSKKARDGSEISFVDGADYFPHSYNGRPYGTYYRIRFTKTGMNLVGLDRRPCDSPTSARVVRLSDSAKKALIEAY